MASDEANSLGSPRIEPVHLLLACLRLADDVVPSWLDEAKLPEEERAAFKEGIEAVRRELGEGLSRVNAARRRIRAGLPQGKPLAVRALVHRSEQAREVFAGAEAEASTSGHRVVGLGDLFAVLADRFSAELADVLPPEIRTRARSAQGGPADGRRPGTNEGGRGASASVLVQFGRDLSMLARERRLPAVVGRKSEMLQAARILQRTNKRNVLLIGDAGVGKTAIVEGLAQRFTSNDAPEGLRQIRIVEVAVSALVAGTTYRGEMEGRVRRLVEEVVADPHLVLFLDEVHLVVRSGSGGGGMDIANILKPALAREDFRCIGATTSEEYDKYVVDDAALARRFQVVRVAEPSRDEAVQICGAWARRLEEKQGVHFGVGVLEAAVDLTLRHIPERRLPDKAIDLLENAAAMARLSSLSFSAKEPGGAPEISTNDLNRVLQEQGVLDADASGDAAFQAARQTLLSRLPEQEELVEALASVLCPADASSHTRTSRVRALIGLRTPDARTFRAVTEAIEAAVFASDGARLLLVDIGPLKQPHELSVLLGAPPGFLGHDRPTALLRFLRANGRGVLAFDNVDAAHADVQQTVASAIEAGEVSDPKGRRLPLGRMVVLLGLRGTSASAGTPIGFRPRDALKAPAGVMDGAASPVFPSPWGDLRLDVALQLE